MFRGVTATGHAAYAPSSYRAFEYMQRHDAESDATDNDDVGIFTDPGVDQQVAPVSGLEVGEPASGQRKRRSEDDGPPRRQQRSSGSIGIAYVMAQAMDKMGDSFVMGQVVRVGSANVNGPNPYSIKECQILLEEIDDPSFDDELCYLAQERFKEPVNRELFCTQVNSSRRLTWLKKEKAKEEKVERMQNMLFK